LGREPVITLHMEAYLGTPEPLDAVEIPGGAGVEDEAGRVGVRDIPRASIRVNSIPKILAVAPGLHTMGDMPLSSFFGGIR
jgi:hypothetical protein